MGRLRRAFITVPCFRVSNFESNAMLFRSVAYDLTFFIALCVLDKLCPKTASSTRLGNTCMRLSMVPSIKSRRVVANGGPRDSHFDIDF